MDRDLFSTELNNFSGVIENPALQDSLHYLQSLAGENFQVMQWDKNRIAVPITIKVELPSLGNYEDIDIQSLEPVIFVFDTLEYPSKAPLVHTNRKDFPKDRLAHLYIAKGGRPPAFCYVRGDSNEWYANKRVNDLVIRISNWLRDAATGQLSSNGQQFEPLRLEGYSGIITYDYDLLSKIVFGKQGFGAAKSFAIGLFEGLKNGSTVSFKLLKIVTKDNLNETIDLFEGEKKKDKTTQNKRELYYGYILWGQHDKSYSHYEIDLPKSWEEFKTFCALYEIETEELENFISIYDSNCFVHFPVIVAIQRPSQVIGFTSSIEFVNFRFRIDTGDVANVKIINNIPISFQSHNQPLTTSLAAKISDSKIQEGFDLAFGCGALGSKILMHFARSGHTKFLLVDPDIISPHNLVRHALLANNVGINKAIALKEEIKKFYPSETENVSTIALTAINPEKFYQADTFNPFSWIFDFTASESFFNKLVLAKNITSPKVCNASISDFGNLGIMFIEGQNRNPRIDDLQMMLYGMFESDLKISEWLKRENSSIAGNITIHVGVGCNSETTVLSDSKVSSHASFFAAALANERVKQNKHGRIFLNRIIEGSDYLIETKVSDVTPFEIFEAVNDQSWSIRFKAGIVGKMKDQMRRAKKKETGGVFIGAINHKTKTIHVMNLIDAPPDSKANAVCFYRGFHNLPSQIESITSGSGNQLGYIGEWHSHPHGPNGLSTVDMESVARFKREFNNLSTPLPAFLTVITPTSVLPHVF